MIPSGSAGPVFGLLGRTLSHSFSAVMFSKVLDSLESPGSYELYEVEPEGVADFVLFFRSILVGGFNVTVPYKQAIATYLDSLSGDAELLGAVNCVVTRDGVLTGYNTDCAAFQACVGSEVEGAARALVLGAGGAAKAAVLALERLQVGSIAVASRRPEQVSADSFLSGRVRHVEFGADALLEEAVSCDVIVNATPVGMSPDHLSAPMMRGFNIGQLVFDMVYNPSPTRFLQLAAGAGAQTVAGLEMLARQAALSLALWTGEEADFRIFLSALTGY